MNIFLKPDVHKRDLHNIHFISEWSKSLYYLQQSFQRAEVASAYSLIGGKINQNENK